MEHWEGVAVPSMEHWEGQLKTGTGHGTLGGVAVSCSRMEHWEGQLFQAWNAGMGS